MILIGKCIKQSDKMSFFTSWNTNYQGVLLKGGKESFTIGSWYFVRYNPTKCSQLIIEGEVLTKRRMR